MYNKLKLFEHLTILYAEDEENIRKTVSSSLKFLFHKVIEAKDGEEALELFYEYNPDVLLLDICMPKCNGLELLKQIRESNKRVPVIIMSAYSEQDYLLQSIDLHVCKYLIKPFVRESFLDAFKACAHWMYEWGDNGLIKVENDIFFDVETSMLLIQNEQISLTKRERTLFEYFLRQKNRVISYDELEYAIWDGQGEHKEALKSLVKQLRKKLPDNMIENFFGVGYKLVTH
ncbi:response regulator transcription factor [Sulfurospirillum barnesii]|uniref:Response regulator with CheY-like receiver domain and winged-helix DNA-binding domain n=1 Tax=Sulfurospirillum barnesii (strain ATCC 700032 / DSM 10660 / SES-3) TaxID=760154 RepID=I3XXI1_SULBS|nr:response regulator transcription factor [Sulfurospirillum barnesii]AFL68655.1 response regulator with CheY-like receiver domain and winged-helix DNA-binding domain [Sulfurospirillum barnesii SES-3]